MNSAWLLPEHVADVLPDEAARLEALRGTWLGVARASGFELVIPPLLEHLESLLAGEGAGGELDLRTFKLVDQLSGRTLGVRADSTAQVARIDAHLLNRDGVVRLCYCGPALHTRPQVPLATREPLQFGAEIYGHAGPASELEVIDVALDGLRGSCVGGLAIDLADVRVVRGVLAGVVADRAALDEAIDALAAKDVPALERLARGWPDVTRDALRALCRLHGGEETIGQARHALPQRALVDAGLDALAALGAHVARTHPEVRVGYDLADVGGYDYYSGLRFAVYADGAPQALLRGGRYDEVGAAFGRNRPAVGFSADLKLLAAYTPPAPRRGAIRAPWTAGADPLGASLRQAVRRLRDDGETVVLALPDAPPADAGRRAGASAGDDDGAGVPVDRELVAVDGRWALRAL